MKSYIKRYPHYYESRGDEDVFAPFTVIAEPLPTRESRVFESGKGGSGVTYESHSIKLAFEDNDKGREFYILMEHGGGREIVFIRGCFNYDLVEQILLMPERAQYSLLYAMYNSASDIATESRKDGIRHALKAYSEKRIRKRSSQGMSHWKIESRQEQKWRFERQGKKAPVYAN